MKKKKILYVHHGKGLGGAPLSLFYLIKALNEKKYDPIVLFLHDSDAFHFYKQNDINVLGPINKYDFSHTHIWWFRWYHPHHLMRSIKDSWRIYFSLAEDWYNKIKPDIVHLNTSSLIAWGVVAQEMNIPVVWHIREPLAYGYLGARKYFITRCVGNNATTIVPISNNEAVPWEKKYAQKISVVYNAVDEKKFIPGCCTKGFLKKYNLFKKTPKILFLGGLSQEKGTLFILKVFQKVLEAIPNAQLLIAGYFDLSLPLHGIKRWSPSSLYKKEVRRFLQILQQHKQHGSRTKVRDDALGVWNDILGIQDNILEVQNNTLEVQNNILGVWDGTLASNDVIPTSNDVIPDLDPGSIPINTRIKPIIFLGPINNVPQAMQASNIVVFPAQVGHFARPVIEAGFMKKSVIASNLPPLDELVIHEKTGFLLPHDDIVSWSNKIIELLHNKGLQEFFGRNACNFCRKKFSLKKQKGKIEEIYQSL
jgi:glycosyltransferase involved in cell wall biosynthesis